MVLRGSQSPGGMLRDRLKRGSVLIAPGCGDALTARLIERAGFDSVFISGYWCSAVRGLPDIGIIGLSELASTCRSIAEGLSIPIICDADIGFGDSVAQVAHCVTTLEATGCAGLIIEDQIAAKKCGLERGRQVIDRDAMTKKLRTASRARKSKDFVIIARTDSLETEGIAGVIDRGSEYLSAGSDLFFVEGFVESEQVAAVSRAFPDSLLVFNRAPIGHGPQISVDRLGPMGYALMLLPLQLLLAAVGVQLRALEEIRRTGYCRSSEPDMASIVDLSHLLGEADIAALERQVEATS